MKQVITKRRPDTHYFDHQRKSPHRPYYLRGSHWVYTEAANARIVEGSWINSTDTSVAINLLVTAFMPSILPMVVLFWYVNGLDSFEMCLLQGMFVLAVVLFDVPNGRDGRSSEHENEPGGSRGDVENKITTGAADLVFAVFLIAELILAMEAGLLPGQSPRFSMIPWGVQSPGRVSTDREASTNLEVVSFAACNVVGGVVGNMMVQGMCDAALWGCPSTRRPDTPSC